MADDLIIGEENESEGTEEGIVEFTSTVEFIHCASMAWSMVDEIDTAILSKSDERRVKRMRRQAMRIMSVCINDLYEELFDDNDEQSATD
jgi:hypothetical protein